MQKIAPSVIVIVPDLLGEMVKYMCSYMYSNIA